MMITPEEVYDGQQTEEGFLIESSLKISNRDLIDVPFTLNAGQKLFDHKIAVRASQGKPIKFYHPKARRRGVSAYITARFLVKAMTQRNIQAAIVAHKEKETKKLFGKISYYVKHFRGARPKLGTDSTIEISFPETDSSISVYTAGSKEVARGLDCNHIHLSEAAFYEDPRSLVASLVQTIPGTGEVFVESTGNGAGTWYHRRCLRAWEGRSSYGINFIPWQDTEDCWTEIPNSYRAEFMASIPNEEFEEEELLAKFPKLEPERILWRRNKIDEFDFDIALFKQEWPMTFEECFRPTTKSYFHKIRSRTDDPRWRQINKNLWLLDGHPNPTLHYSLGADVAAGVEKDASPIEILCLETNEQVGEYWSNRVAPDDFAREIELIGELFFWPIAVIEANNHGHVTLDNLMKNHVYPQDKIYWDEAHATNIVRAGHTTNRRTKPLMVGSLRTALAHTLTVYSTGLVGECATFEDTLQAAKECHDDRVIALALANKGLDLIIPTIGLSSGIQIVGIGEFASVFGNRDRRVQTGQPISRQNASAWAAPQVDIRKNVWLSAPDFLN